jgi:hypothetical protein
MDDKLDDLLNDNSEFDAIKALLEEPEELGLGPIVGMNNPTGCTPPGPPTAPGGGYSYPTGRSTESLQMIFQQVLPGGNFLTGVGGARGQPGAAPTGGITTFTGGSHITIQNPANITIVAAYCYWNIVMAADNAPTAAPFFNYGDTAAITIQGSGPLGTFGPNPVYPGGTSPVIVGVSNNCGWAAYNQGSGQDGGSPPQNIINVVCRYDLMANTYISGTIATSGVTTFTFANLPFQTGLGNASPGGGSQPYYPGCKVAQGVAIVIVYKQPTNPQMRQVTIYDGSTMLVSPSNPGAAAWQNSPSGGVGQSPASGQYTINYNSKYIEQPVFFWGIGDAQSSYDNMAYLNGTPLTSGSNFWNPSSPSPAGNLIAMPVVTTTPTVVDYELAVPLQAGLNTFTAASVGANGDFMTMFLFAIAAGDPHFAGFDGEKFDFHGEPHKFYNLLSDDNIQVNAYFSDWPSDTSGHDFTATRRAGIVVKDIYGLYNIVIDSDGYVAIDGFEVTNKYLSFGINSFIRIIDNYDDIGHKDLKEFDGFGDFTRAYEVSTPEYRIIFVAATDNYNGYYLNFLAEIKNPELRPHGVVGQTADGDGKPREAIPHTYQGEGVIEGDYPDYEVSGLFENDFKYNKFMVDNLVAV